MIVVDPDEVVGFYKRRDSLREALIDPLIAAAEAAVIFGEVDPVMEEWPQRPVGIAVIIFVDVLFFRSEEHTSELQSLMRISYAVFCLKKKKTKHKHTFNHISNKHKRQQNI